MPIRRLHHWLTNPAELRSHDAPDKAGQGHHTTQLTAYSSKGYIKPTQRKCPALVGRTLNLSFYQDCSDRVIDMLVMLNSLRSAGSSFK